MKAISTRTKRWTTAMFAGLLVVGVSTIGQAADGGTVDGNPKCEGFDFGWKAENPGGTYVIDRDGLHLTLTVGTYPQEGVVEPNHDNAVLTYAVDPSSEVQSGQIIVKGGPAATVYSFDASTPLHAPAVPSGKWPTISHVQVCWDEPEEPEPEFGAIELTKAVTGTDAPTDVDFELCITGPAPDTTKACTSVGAGETATFDALEPGDYTVTETDPGIDWTVTYSATTLTVTADQTATATVTNTWQPEEPVPPVAPEHGTIVLTKAVTGTGAPANAVFGLCITGPGAGGTPECELVSAGQTATFGSLEPGVYVVTETDPGTGWTVTYSAASLTVVADQTATATVTNTWETQAQLSPTPTTTVVSPSGGAVTTQPQSDALPVTGGDGRLALTQAGLAAGVLAAGTILMRLSRRPEHTTG